MGGQPNTRVSQEGRRTMGIKLATIIWAECPRLFWKHTPFECNDGWFPLVLDLSR